MSKAINSLIFLHTFVNSPITDHELTSTISEIEVELAENIKRGFTNIGIKQNYLANKTEDFKQFTDISIKDGNNHISLRNLKFQEILPRIRKSKTNLMYNVIEVELDLSDIVLNGEFEVINTELFALFPFTNLGSLEVIFRNTKASGLVGFAITGDVFLTTNIDIDYTYDSLELVMAQSGSETFAVVNKESIDDTILSSYKNQLWQKITNVIQGKLDQVMSDVSMFESFRGDADILGRYIKRSDAVNKFVDDFVDKLLFEMKTEHCKMITSFLQLPDVNTTFSYTAGIVTINGYFQAINGYIGDVSTMRRRRQFSLFVDEKNHIIKVFGSICANVLKVGYSEFSANVFFLKPGGTLTLTAGENVLSFVITTATLTNGLPDFSTIVSKIEIVQLDDIEVFLTGIGAGPLNWLTSRISTWMIGIFKTELIVEAENSIRQTLDKVFQNTNAYLSTLYGISE